MKTIIYLTLFASQFLAFAQRHPYDHHYQTIETQSTDTNVYGKVFLSQLDLLPHDKVEVYFEPRLKTTEEKSQFLHLKDKYAFEANLIDSNGKAVSKTEKGQTLGKLFNQLSEIPDEDLLETAVVWKVSGGDYHHPARYRAFVEGGIQQSLPPLNELFKLEEPGTYELRIKIQMLIQRREKWEEKATNEIIQFDPVKIKFTYD